MNNGLHNQIFLNYKNVKKNKNIVTIHCNKITEKLKKCKSIYTSRYYNKKQKNTWL